MKNKFDNLKFMIFSKHPYKLSYYLRHPIQFFSHYYYDIKHAYQRATKGYSNMDLWDVDYWFKDIMVRLLTDFKNNNQGYPSNMTPDEWDNILDEIIHSFKEGNKDSCSLTNNYEHEYNNWLGKQPLDTMEQKIKQDCIQNYIHAEIAIEQMRQKNTQHALELLGKYLSDLWY